MNYIKSFSFFDSNNYLILSKNIIDSFEENKNYLIAFDQYNDSNDPDNILDIIIKNNKNKGNIKFLVFEDVRKIKKNNLFGGFDREKYYEISKICIIRDKNLKEDEKIALDKLGGTFKALIEIKNANNIDKYLNMKKYKLTKKLISFYISNSGKNENYFDDNKQQILRIPYKIIGEITSFKIDFLYGKKYLSKIIDYIPFRFFIFEIHEKEKYKIKFAFPLVEESMKDIYKIISVKYSYNYLKTILDDRKNFLNDEV